MATYHIDALEDSELVLISKSAHEELLLKVPTKEWGKAVQRMTIVGIWSNWSGCILGFNVVCDHLLSSFHKFFN